MRDALNSGHGPVRAPCPATLPRRETSLSILTLDGWRMRGFSLRENAHVRGANGHVLRKPSPKVLNGVPRRSSRFVMAALLMACLWPPRVLTAAEKPAVPSSPVKVELKEIDGRYQLFRNGKPYYIAGAGLEFGNAESLARHGGNSFRTWRTENGRESGQVVLDRAWKNGLTVTLGIAMMAERHGADYADDTAVADQFARVKREVLKYMDHPALIIWAIGNELNLSAKNPRVWDAVNDISKMIHKVDPNHLTTTTLAGINKDLVRNLQERAPDLDLLCIQMYADLPNLP